MFKKLFKARHPISSKVPFGAGAPMQHETWRHQPQAPVAPRDYSTGYGTPGGCEPLSDSYDLSIIIRAL